MWTDVSSMIVAAHRTTAVSSWRRPRSDRRRAAAFDASVLPRWHRAWHARGAARAHIARNTRDRALGALEEPLREDFLLSRLDVE